MASTCAFFTLASIQNSPESDPTKPPGKLGWFKQPSNSTPNRNLNLKASVQPPIMTNNTLIKARGPEEPSPSGFNRFLVPMSSIFTGEVAKSKDQFSLLNFVENGLVFRQNFAIRSYEIGPDGKVSMEALMNHLQETGLNHMKLTGLLGDGLGSTPEMCARKLIWVATKVELVVDRYPTWGDDVVIDNWIVASGKNTMRRDSVIRDSKTGESLIRASSNWVVMNKETRRLSRIPEEVRDEMSPYLKDASPIIEDENRKLPKLDDDTANYILPGLKPRWSDLDINQHVNNGKYIGWILESAPNEILENREISRVAMEYRRECHRDDELQSLTAICGGVVSDFADLGEMECHHMLRVEDGAEVMRARTEWRPKNVCTLGNDN